jgi:NADH:ubiquinone oxidoreductase subunit 5 (subunit L)/multisubunit Na+/H+ antiporter MnhA subunit
VQAIKAAFKALLVNRIGDFFFLLGVSFLIKQFKSCDFDVIFSLIPYYYDFNFLFMNYKVHFLSFLAFCFSIAAIGKSAQLGLHIWLPDAMEGPTPVSALIHAATMVTAGIYLLLRLMPILICTKIILLILMLLGGLTAFFSALISTVQFDIKKIIAYSTCSQLGYMFVAIGLAQPQLAFYHLINHAFFKALLFLVAGSIIHSLNGEQDIRKMGGLLGIFPIQYICFLIASLSMIGFFFFSGFYSKELIISVAYISSETTAVLLVYWFIVLTTFLTAAYSFRLIYNVFFGTYRGYYPNFLFLHIKLPSYQKYIFGILCIFSILSGYFLKSFFNNSFFFDYVLPTTFNQTNTEFVIPVLIK